MPEAVLEADVAVQGERIAGLLKTPEPVQAHQVIDARGLYVVPGGIDAHVHIVAHARPTCKRCAGRAGANLCASDATIYTVLRRLGILGSTAAVPTENCDIVAYCTARLLAAGQRSPVHYPLSRPTFTEVEC